MAVNDSVTQNLLPVQAYFDLQGNFQTFIGQNQPFYATVNPSQSGLNITNSTIDSTTIGATTPSTGVFTNVSATTGQISTTPSANIDIANKFYVDTVAQGLGPKAACQVATTANITLSGLQTIDGYTTLAGDRILVKNQTSSQFNGIYVASASTWTRSTDMDVWSEVPGAYTVILNGGQLDTGWVCTATQTGTINVTAMPWVQFAGNNTYFAGTGLSLSSNTFSITNTGVTANTYGSASAVPVIAVNAQGQITSATTTSISIANTQVTGLGTMSTQNANAVAITGGSINGTTIGASTASTISGTTITATTQFSGAGTGLTGTATSLNIGGNAATATYATTAGSASSATTATTATNLAGGATGSLPYQSSANNTTFLAAGSNGQYLTLSSGVPAWTSLPANVSSFSAGTTGFTPSTSTTGAVTLSGTLNVANGGTGVTSSSGANSVVLRDSNGNITTNCLFEGYVTQAASGTTITLIASSAQNYQITGSGGQVIQLPNATTLPNGATFTFNNNQSSGTITVNNNSSTTVATINSGGYVTVVLLSNSTAAGSWDRHDSTPSNVSWSTNTLDYPGSITSATWNGTVVAYNRGGTGQSSAFVTGGVVYGSSTTALAVTAAGTTGQFLQSNGTGAPTWATPTSYATVTDDTTTNGTRYPLFANQTSGNLSTEYTSSTKLQYNPSTGALSATSFVGTIAGSNVSGNISGNAANVTGTVAIANGGTGQTTASAAFNALSPITTTGDLIIGNGTNSATRLGIGTNGYILTSNGTTASWVAAPATGVTISDDTSSATAYYPLFARVTSGTATTEYTSSTKLNYTPSTGVLAATSFSGSGANLTGVVTSVTGTSPVVSSGGQTPAISLATGYGDTQNPYASKTANYFLAAPNGSAGAPTFRAIVAADIPTLNQNTTGTASNITASSNSTLTTLSALSLPGSQVSGNISGNAANVTGTVAIANGGTGQTTASSAFNALSPITTTGDLIIGNGTNSATRLPIGSNTYVLTSNGTTATWAAASGGGATVTSTTSAGPYYIVGSSTTSGTLSTAYVSTGISYNASTGNATAPQHVSSNGLTVNSSSVSTSYTVASGYNAVSVGPITVASGQSVTVSSGQRWVVL